MQGLHSLDVAIIIAPALFELLTGVANSMNLKYEDGLSDKNEMIDASLVARAMKKPEADQFKEELEEEDMKRVEEAASLMAKPVRLNEEETE